MLIYATVFITLALIFYTIGVWAEKIQKRLKYWHMYMFWVGVVFDTTGTTLMTRISDSRGFKLDFHDITGLLAILLMLFHAIWATIVLAKKNEKMILSFHKFSIIVWIIWLIPYFGGLIFGVSM
jgi:uncharacterized repeat protein (TIGR03987 family)